MSTSIGRKATKVIKDGNGSVTVKYHSTPVVHFDKNYIILNTGGWRTQTTKRRMNQASQMFGLDIYVYAEKGEWFANYHGKKNTFTGKTLMIPRY